MIDLYTWTTPNGRKASIALEEFGLPYNAHAVDISKDEQFKPEFLKICPNNRIPAIVDRDNGISSDGVRRDPDLPRRQDRKVSAEGRREALPHDRMADVADGRARPDAWPGASLCEIQQGQGALRRGALFKEAHRLYGVLDKRLADNEFLADDYSIADIATWPWISRYEWQTIDMNQYPEREALVSRDRQAAGGAEGLPGAEEGAGNPDAVRSGGSAMNVIDKTEAKRTTPVADFDRFRLRRFVDGLDGSGRDRNASRAGRARRHRRCAGEQRRVRSNSGHRCGAPGTGRQCHRQPRPAGTSLSASRRTLCSPRSSAVCAASPRSSRCPARKRRRSTSCSPARTPT